MKTIQFSRIASAMRSTTLAALFAAAANICVFAGTAAAEDTVLDSFDDYADSADVLGTWYQNTGWSGGTLDVTLNTDTDYVSTGTQSLCVGLSGLSYGFLQYGIGTSDLQTLIEGMTSLSFDVYVTSTTWANISLIIQTNNGTTTLTGYLSDGETSALVADAWNTVTFTPTEDEIAAMLTADLTWSNVLFQVSGDSTSGTTFYIDNLIETAPDPEVPSYVEFDSFDDYADETEFEAAWYKSSGWSGANITVTLNTDTDYVTNGTQSLCAAFGTTGSSYAFLQAGVSASDMLDILTNYRSFTADMYITSADWANCSLIIQTGNGYKQFTGYLSDGTTTDFVVDAWNTVTFTYSDDDATTLIGDGFTWASFLMQICGSSTTGTTYYIDNVYAGDILWMGYTVLGGYADTGSWLGDDVYAAYDPFIYANDHWLYFDDDSATDDGAWGYVYNMTGTTFDSTADTAWMGIDDGDSDGWVYTTGTDGNWLGWVYVSYAPVVWSTDLGWMYPAEETKTDDGVWAWFYKE